MGAEHAAVHVRLVDDDEPRLVTPRWFGWGYDLNVAQVLRRLGVRR